MSHQPEKSLVFQEPITTPPGEIAPPFLNDDMTPQEAEKLKEKAVGDSKDAPSVTFINFPVDIPDEAREKLIQYEDDVLQYRSWASLIWENSVDKNPDLPTDGSPESKMKRTSYLARVGDYHMRHTPWLAKKIDTTDSKKISCKTSQFHTELIKNVLKGFVGLTPPILLALEAVLESISETIEVSKGESHVSLIVSEKYEYEELTKRIRSFVCLTAFALGTEAYQIHTRKKSVEWMDCEISYSKYEAEFSDVDWKKTAAKIEEWKLKAMEDFVKEETVDLPP